MGTCPRPCSVVRDPSGTPFVASTATHPRGVSDGSQEKSTRKIKYLKVPTYVQQQRCHENLPAFSVLADWHRCAGGLDASRLVRVCAFQFVPKQGLSPFRAGFGTWIIPW